jgi:hypothetical protein
MPLEASHTITESSDYTVGETSKKNSPVGMKLDVSDNPPVNALDLIYVYNTVDIEHIVEQPPQFPRFIIPACPRDKKFTYNILPRWVNERHEVIERNEWNYKRVDGRKYATSLLNPSVHPSAPFEAQFTQPKVHGDQTGNDLNGFGCFWSLTKPDDPKLMTEIANIKKRVMVKAREIVKEAEALAAAGHLHLITPRQHFFMDYLGLQSRWHMPLDHMVACPNCGDNIKDDLAYHKNQFGEKCIIDWKRAYEAGAVKKDDVPESKRWWAEEETVEAGAGPKNSAGRGSRKAQA